MSTSQEQELDQLTEMFQEMVACVGVCMKFDQQKSRFL